MNTSSLSRKLAHGGKDSDVAIAEALVGATTKEAGKSKRSTTNQECSTKALFALVRTYGCLWARWGGSGKDDIVGRASVRKKSADNERRPSTKDALGKADPLAQSLLNAICFSTPLVETLWALIQSDSETISDLYNLIDDDKA